jgi:hypothetical protein
MLLVGYCYGIRSELRLCEEVHLDLAYRWFCRLDLNDRVPDHSTFSKNRHVRFRDSALLHHLSETTVADMGNGIDLAQFHLSEAVRLADAATVSVEIDRAEALRKWMLDGWTEPEIMVRDVVRLGPNALRESPEASAALALLERHACARCFTGGKLAYREPRRACGLICSRRLTKSKGARRPLWCNRRCSIRPRYLRPVSRLSQVSQRPPPRNPSLQRIQPASTRTAPPLTGDP